MILIALGANLPSPQGCPPVETCRRAARALGRLPGLRVVRASRLYRTAPVPPSGQPDYVNGVVALQGAADPVRLLAILHRIERAAGRTRGAPNAARTLDLDLIDLNGLVRDTPDPVLPHPRAHLRGFVLHPLAEIAPDWHHPRFGTGVGALIEALADSAPPTLVT